MATLLPLDASSERLGRPGSPDVTVVIASNGSARSVVGCLEALEHQRDGAEVLVYEPVATPAEDRARFGWARWEVRPGAGVPSMWRDGIDASTGAIVALTISPMRPAADWLETIRRRVAPGTVIAGAIDPGEELRLVDWAEYFCRYAKDASPFEERETADLPGDNCAYARELLERSRELYRDGFWEPVVNDHLAREGADLRQIPELVVRQGRSAGRRAFTRQRLVHGRAHGRQRGATFTLARNVAGVLGAPLVPVLLTLRALSHTRGQARRRFILALPDITLFNLAWAAGEARGHLDALVTR